MLKKSIMTKLKGKYPACVNVKVYRDGMLYFSDMGSKKHYDAVYTPIKIDKPISISINLVSIHLVLDVLKKVEVYDDYCEFTTINDIIMRVRAPYHTIEIINALNDTMKAELSDSYYMFRDVVIKNHYIGQEV